MANNNTEVRGVNSPRIYIGTYRQYSNGSTFGDWFDLCDYADAEEFGEAIQEYHKKEFEMFGECEYMAQDYEYIPAHLVNDGYISNCVFEILQELEEDKIEFFFKWCELQGVRIDDKSDGHDLVNQFNDVYIGHFEYIADVIEWAEEQEAQNLLYKGIDVEELDIWRYVDAEALWRCKWYHIAYYDDKTGLLYWRQVNWVACGFCLCRVNRATQSPAI